MEHGSGTIGRGEFLERCATLFALAAFGRSDSRWPDPPRSFPHPDPRPDITAERVLSVETLGSSRPKRVMDAYEAARKYPEILDGLYCACQCSGKSGHRSLLVCFETMQPTGCGGCQEEAELAGKLAKQEKTLADIRLAVDKAYG